MERRNFNPFHVRGLGLFNVAVMLAGLLGGPRSRDSWNLMPT